MSTLRVNNWSNPPEDFAATGQWWLPTNPSKTAFGTIAFSGAGALLDTMGELIGNVSRWPGETTILGQLSDGKEVTLPSARLGGQSLLNDEIASERWTGSSLLVGGWLPDGNESTFDQIDLRTVRLGDWASPRAQVSLASKSISTEVPSSIRCEIPALGTVWLNWEMESNMTPRSATLRVHPTLVLDADEPLTMREMWRQFVIPMVEFLTLATGEPDAVLSLKLGTPRSGPDHSRRLREASFQWYTTTLRAREVSQGGSYYQHLIPFEAVEADLPERLTCWFSIESKHRFALNQFFAGLLNPIGSDEESFDRVVRALEVWHRVDSPASLMPEDEYAALLASLKLIAPSHAEFLNQRLMHQNSPSLKQRLDRLTEEAGSPVAETIGAVHRFARRTVDTRNGLTHRADPGEHFSGESLVVAERLWRIVLRSILLRRLGFESPALEAMIKRSEDGTYLGLVDL